MCLFSVIVSIFFIFPFFKKEENKRSEEKSSYYPIYVHQIQDRIGEIVKKLYEQEIRKGHNLTIRVSKKH